MGALGSSVILTEKQGMIGTSEPDAAGAGQGQVQFIINAFGENVTDFKAATKTSQTCQITGCLYGEESVISLLLKCLSGVRIPFLKTVRVSHPFSVLSSVSLPSRCLPVCSGCFVCHDLVRPRCSGFLISSKITLGDCASIHFGQRDWEQKQKLAFYFLFHSCFRR